MADVKISVTGDELIELRTLLAKAAGKLDDVQVEAAIRTCGYALEHCTLDEQLEYIAGNLLKKMR